jgi:hypothetical protein
MVELGFNVKKQDIRVLLENYFEKESRELAEKVVASNVFSSIKRTFGKKEEIEVTHSEKRYEPFWHIVGESFIEYLRNTTYGVNVSPEVRRVKINGKVMNVEEDRPFLTFVGEDHCVEKYEKEVFFDASEGKEDKKLKDNLEFDSREIKETEELMGHNKVVIPARVKASFLIRDMIKDMIKPVQADKVVQEKVQITKLSLYFRPIYAFEFTVNPSGKKKVFEVDALTGKVSKGSVFKRELKELMPEHALFEIGAELASVVLPGAPIAAVIGREISKRKKKKKDLAAMKVSQEAHKKSKKEPKPRKKVARKPKKLSLKGSKTKIKIR